jgi:hypothetical protein
MQYFKTSDPTDMSHGELSKRVRFLKQEDGGIEYMCQVADEIFEEGREEGLKGMAINLFMMGFPIEKIAEAAKESVDVIRQWIDGITVAAS